VYKDKQNCFELVLFLFYLVLIKKHIDNCCGKLRLSVHSLAVYWYTKLGCYVDVKFEEFDDEFNAVFTSNINQHLRDPLLS